MSAQDIVLSPEESAELSRRTRSATISQRDGRRARVILLAAQGCSRVEIARLVGFSLRSVTLWCKRFQEQGLDGLIDKPGSRYTCATVVSARFANWKAQSPHFWHCEMPSRLATFGALREKIF